MNFLGFFKQKPQEKKESLGSILLGYTILLKNINTSDFIRNHELLSTCLLSCSMEKSVATASSLAMSISILALKQEVELLRNTLLDTMSYSETRNSEICGYIAEKIKESYLKEDNLLIEAENTMIRALEGLLV